MKLLLLIIGLGLLASCNDEGWDEQQPKPKPRDTNITIQKDTSGIITDRDTAVL